MSEPEKIISHLSGLHARQIEDLLFMLDRANQGHSVFRGVAHDLSNASMAFAIGAPADDAGENEAEKWASMTKWVEEKLNRAVAILRDFGTAVEDEERPVLVQETLAAAHSWQSLQRSQPEIPVRLEVAKDLAPVRASETRMRQVFLALMANAKEAMNGQHETEIRLAAKPNANGVLIVVEDSGPGIDNVIADRVFDAFFTTKDPDSHHGLGLTVARAAVERWGGSLSIEARAEGGARAEMWLPCLTQ